MGAAWLKQTRVPVRLITQQQQTLRVGVESANGIHAGREREIHQRTMRRTIRCELRQHAVGFVKSDQHWRRLEGGGVVSSDLALTTRSDGAGENEDDEERFFWACLPCVFPGWVSWARHGRAAEARGLRYVFR